MEGDQLTSTWEHRLITGGALFLIATLFAEGVSEIASPVEAITGVAAFLIAYALSGDNPTPLRSCTAATEHGKDCLSGGQSLGHMIERACGMLQTS